METALSILIAAGAVGMILSIASASMEQARQLAADPQPSPDEDAGGACV